MLFGFLLLKNLLIDGIKLHFVDINSSSTNTLLFIHGNSHSYKTFSNQLNSPLFKDYRLVAIDLPGHGASSISEQYSLKNFALILHKFILLLKLDNVLVIGHSLGGHVGINLLRYSKLAGLFVFGTPPINNPFDPNLFLTNPNTRALGQMQSSVYEIEILMQELNYKNDFLNLGLEDYIRTDPMFRLKILSDIIAGIHENEIDLIKTFQNCSLILLATQDSLINNSYIRNEFLNENEKYQLLEIVSGHSPHIEVSSMFNSILSDFSKKVFD